MNSIKHISLFAFVLFVVQRAYGVDYARIDTESNFVPFNCKSPTEIAGYLTRNLFTPEEKVRALFFWTANTLSYDVRQLPGTDYRYVTSGRRDILQEAIGGHKGVCQHYAVLFDALCRAAGIQSWVITGYVRKEENDTELSHAWNAVRINDSYYCLDLTWSAGYIEDGHYVKDFNDKYFLVSPDKFIRTHVPFDPVFQFSDNPFSHASFAQKDAAETHITPFSFRDSLTVSCNRDTLKNLICQDARIRHAGISNLLIQTYCDFNRQQINIWKLNTLIDAYNRCIHAYNTYITARNRQFDKGTIPADTLLQWLGNSRKFWLEAKHLSEGIDRKDENTDRQFQSLQNSISRLHTDIAQQEIFLKKYMDTPDAERMQLFIVP